MKKILPSNFNRHIVLQDTTSDNIQALMEILGSFISQSIDKYGVGLATVAD